MKKKLLFVPLMVVACAFSLMLSACGGTPAEDLIRADLEEYFGDSQSAHDEFADGLEESAGSDLDLLGIDVDDFTDAYLDGFSYEIGDITVDGDTAIAQVTVSAKSMSDIMTTFETEFTNWISTVDATTLTSQDDVYKQGGQILLEVMQSVEATEGTYEVSYTKNSDGEWEMDSSSESDLMNAVLS